VRKQSLGDLGLAARGAFAEAPRAAEAFQMIGIWCAIQASDTTMLQSVLDFISSMALAIAATFGFKMGIEQPRYDVIERIGSANARNASSPPSCRG